MVLSYVEKFKYLGDILSDNFTDDDSEKRSLAMRGNFLIRKFIFRVEYIKFIFLVSITSVPQY